MRNLEHGRGAEYGTGVTVGTCTTSTRAAAGRGTGQGKGIKEGKRVDENEREAVFLCFCSRGLGWGRFTSEGTCGRYICRLLATYICVQQLTLLDMSKSWIDSLGATQAGGGTDDRD